MLFISPFTFPFPLLSTNLCLVLGIGGKDCKNPAVGQMNTLDTKLEME